jgi:dihydroneopterin aldolase
MRALGAASQTELTDRALAPYVPAVPIHQSITLRGMRFHTLVGVLPHEEQLPQPLEIDVTVWLVPSGSGGRPTADPLDYRALYDAVSGAIGSRPVRYLEELIERTADTALALGGVHRVRVAARKPHVALPGPLEYAEVVIERDQHA